MKKILLTIIVLLCSIFSVFAIQVTEDNFNRADGTLGTATNGNVWTYYEPNGWLISNNELTAQGTYDEMMMGYIISNARVDFQSPSPNEVNFDLKLSNVPASLSIMGRGTGNYGFGLIFDSGSILGWNSQRSGYVVLSTIPSDNQFHTYSLKNIGYVNKSIDFYIDGTYITTWQGFEQNTNDLLKIDITPQNVQGAGVFATFDNIITDDGINNAPYPEIIYWNNFDGTDTHICPSIRIESKAHTGQVSVNFEVFDELNNSISTHSFQANEQGSYFGGCYALGQSVPKANQYVRFDMLNTDRTSFNSQFFNAVIGPSTSIIPHATTFTDIFFQFDTITNWYWNSYPNSIFMAQTFKSEFSGNITEVRVPIYDFGTTLTGVLYDTDVNGIPSTYKCDLGVLTLTGWELQDVYWNYNVTDENCNVIANQTYAIVLTSSTSIQQWAWGYNSVGNYYIDGGVFISDDGLTWTQESSEYDLNAYVYGNVDTTIIINPILGCMNSTANNYNSTATEDDGSCLYNITQPTGGGGGGSSSSLSNKVNEGNITITTSQAFSLYNANGELDLSLVKSLEEKTNVENSDIIIALTSIGLISYGFRNIKFAKGSNVKAKRNNLIRKSIVILLLSGLSYIIILVIVNSLL